MHSILSFVDRSTETCYLATVQLFFLSAVAQVVEAKHVRGGKFGGKKNYIFPSLIHKRKRGRKREGERRGIQPEVLQITTSSTGTKNMPHYEENDKLFLMELSIIYPADVSVAKRARSCVYTIMVMDRTWESVQNQINSC